MGLCLTDMHPFGLKVPARGIATSLLTRLRGMPPRVGSTLLRSRRKVLERRPATRPLVEVPRLAHDRTW